MGKDSGGSVGDTSAYLEVEPRFVETALRYYGSNQADIDDWLARVRDLNAGEEAKWRARDALSA